MKSSNGKPTAVIVGQSRRKAPGASPITLKDVAAAAGVSPQTVSYVVNNKGVISQEVRTRVLQVADNMGYRPNQSAKAMRTGRSQTIGLVLDDIAKPFWAEFAQAAERAAAARGLAVLLVDAHALTEDTTARIEKLRAHPVDGVVTGIYNDAIAGLRLPTVTICPPVPGRDSVNSDDNAGGALLAKHLLDLGHRKFGLITIPFWGPWVRRKAFIDRLPPDAQIMWECHTETSEGMTEAIRSHLALQTATAIICNNDQVAVEALRVLRGAGIKVPNEVSVVGYDDVSWATIVTPSLTTVRQPWADLGARAIELLVARMEYPRRKPRHLVLSVELIERESTGPAPKLKAPLDIRRHGERLRQWR